MNDLISRQAAIDALIAEANIDGAYGYISARDANIILDSLPSVQPTLYGYNIEHLKLIAAILRKEDLPPERVKEALTDIGRIVEMVQAEQEAILRNTLEQYAKQQDWRIPNEE